MNVSQLLKGIFRGDPLPDPGNAGTITVDRSPCVCALVSAAAETRTLERPTREGAHLFLYMKTDGGDITLTVTGGYNEDGDTTFLYDDAGEFAEFVSAYDGTNYFWRMTSSHAITILTQTEAGFLEDVTAGTGAASKALVLDANGDVVMPAGGVIAISRAVIAALGTNDTNAAALTAQINLVTGADNAKGVVLPAAAVTDGPITVVNTSATARLFVYPVSGGNDNINGLAEDLAMEVGPGEEIEFTPVSAVLWYARVPHNNFAFEIVTTTNVITAFENGKTFFLDNATGFVSTLPTAAIGLKFSFVIKTAVTTTAGHTIVCPAAAAIIKGHVLTNDVNSATDSDFGVTGEATLTFVINKAVAGDRIDVVCDGTNWHARGECSVFDAITLA